MAFASAHRLVPAVHWGLRASGFRGVPDVIRAQLQKSFLSTVGTNMVYAELLATLLRRLEARGVRVIALKGPVAAYAHHGNLAARQFGDLDLLVPQEHISAAMAELRRAGFMPSVSLEERHLRILLRTRRELPFTCATGAVVDLHWKSMEPHLSWCPEEVLWGRSVLVDFEGVPVRLLGPVDLGLYYCLKAAEDGWRAAYQLLDAARVVETLGEESWDHLFAWSQQAGKWRAVGASIVLVHGLFGIPVPPIVLDNAERRRDVRELASRAATRLLGTRPCGRSFPLLVAEQLRCLERWRDKASLLRMLGLQPGERDLTLLPSWLVFPPFLQIVRIGRTVGNLAAAALAASGVPERKR